MTSAVGGGDAVSLIIVAVVVAVVVVAAVVEAVVVDVVVAVVVIDVVFVAVVVIDVVVVVVVDVVIRRMDAVAGTEWSGPERGSGTEVTDINRKWQPSSILRCRLRRHKRRHGLLRRRRHCLRFRRHRYRLYL